MAYRMDDVIIRINLDQKGNYPVQGHASANTSD